MVTKCYVDKTRAANSIQRLKTLLKKRPERDLKEDSGMSIYHL